MGSFHRELLNDMAERRPILKNKLITYHLRFGFTLKTGIAFSKAGFCVYCVPRTCVSNRAWRSLTQLDRANLVQLPSFVCSGSDMLAFEYVSGQLNFHLHAEHPGAARFARSRYTWRDVTRSHFSNAPWRCASPSCVALQQASVSMASPRRDRPLRLLSRPQLSVSKGLVTFLPLKKKERLLIWDGTAFVPYLKWTKLAVRFFSENITARSHRYWLSFKFRCFEWVAVIIRSRSTILCLVQATTWKRRCDIKYMHGWI